MAFCGECGSPVDGVKFCTTCGTPIMQPAPSRIDKKDFGSRAQEPSRPIKAGNQILGDNRRLSTIETFLYSSLVLTPSVFLLLFSTSFREGGGWAVFGNFAASTLGWAVLGLVGVGALRIATKRQVFSQLMVALGLWAASALAVVIGILGSAVAGPTSLEISEIGGSQQAPEPLETQGSPPASQQNGPKPENAPMVSSQNCRLFDQMKEPGFAGVNLDAYSDELSALWSDETDAQLATQVQKIQISISDAQQAIPAGDASAYQAAATRYYAAIFEIQRRCSEIG